MTDLENSGSPFQLAEVEENLKALRPWNVQFEVPDVIGFDDFLSNAHGVALLASDRACGWHRTTLFPYPNGSKLRTLAVLDPIDLAITRAAVGRLTLLAEATLPPCVFGYRTISNGSRWMFKGRTSDNWRTFTNTAIRMLMRGDLRAMCSTDIAAYYGSICLDRLENQLVQIGGDAYAISVLLSGLRTWRDVDNLNGIPIGPEMSGVLGNIFLAGLDHQLTRHGTPYLRWMDDYRLMAPDEAKCRSIVDPLDEMLHAKGLVRSVQKTVFYDSPSAAIAALRDGKLASLGFWLDSDTPQTESELHRAWTSDVVAQSDRPRYRYRYILKALRNRQDNYAAADIVDDTELANVDPQLAAQYLATVAFDASRIVDGIFNHLGRSPTDRNDALDLHLLRACATKKRPWGSIEGNIFRSIACNTVRRSPLRSWAVQAEGNSDVWRQESTMERAEAEHDPLVRRALVATLRKVRPGRRRDTFLTHIAQVHPDLQFTSRWVQNDSN